MVHFIGLMCLFALMAVIMFNDVKKVVPVAGTVNGRCPAACFRGDIRDGDRGGIRNYEGTQKKQGKFRLEM